MDSKQRYVASFLFDSIQTANMGSRGGKAYLFSRMKTRTGSIDSATLPIGISEWLDKRKKELDELFMSSISLPICMEYPWGVLVYTCMPLLVCQNPLYGGKNAHPWAFPLALPVPLPSH